MVTGYVYDDRMTNHFHPSEGHPEQPDRIRCIRDAMQENDLLSKCIKIPIVPSTLDEISSVHDLAYLSMLLEAQKDPDEMEIIRLARKFNSIYLNQFSIEAALFASGGTVALAKAIMDRKINNGFAIVRPPGHHAESHCAMGFCLFNNVAVSIKQLRLQYPTSKVMILDWDIHHGNGTQEIFLQDPDVLYCSIHRYEDATFYPHSEEGNCTQVGVGKGIGKTLNIPWPDCGMGDADYLHVFSRIVMPVAYEFAPDLVIVSAGFDAAVGDPIGECMVTPDGFAMMTYMLKGLANGRLMLVLEGGYDLDSLSLGATACMRILLGMDPPQLSNCTPSMTAIETANDVIKNHAPYWKSLGYFWKDFTFSSSPATTPLSSVLLDHWNETLEGTLQMTSLKLNNLLLRKYERYLHVSELFLTSTSPLVFFIHGNGFVRSCNMVANYHDPSQIMLNAPYLDYTQSFLAAGYSIVDLMLPLDEVIIARLSASGELDDSLSPGALDRTILANGNADSKSELTIIDQLLSYIWKKIVLISKSQHLFIVATDDTCKLLLALLEREPVEETSLKGIVMLHPDAQLVPCPRSKALWLYDRSLFIYPNDGAMGSLMNFGKLFGNTISSGTAYKHDYPHLLEHFRETVLDFIKRKSRA